MTSSDPLNSVSLCNFMAETSDVSPVDYPYHVSYTNTHLCWHEVISTLIIARRSLSNVEFSVVKDVLHAFL